MSDHFDAAYQTCCIYVHWIWLQRSAMVALCPDSKDYRINQLDTTTETPENDWQHDMEPPILFPPLHQNADAEQPQIDLTSARVITLI